MLHHHRIPALLLCACLLLALLAGCSGRTQSQSSAEPDQDPDATVWAPAFTPLPEGTGYFYTACINGGYLYYVPESANGGENAVPQPALYRAALDGSGFERLAGYAPPVLPEDREGSVSLSDLCAAPDGGLWVCERLYSYYYDLPDDFAGSNEEREAYFVSDGGTWQVRRLNADGGEEAVVDLSSPADDPERFYIQDMACDGEGNLYLSMGESGIRVYDKNGAPLFAVKDDSIYADALATLSDGTVAASGYVRSGDNGHFAVIPLDTAGKTWGQAIEIDGYSDRLFDGGGDYLFLYSSGSSLFGLRVDTGDSEKLFGWVNCDISDENVRGLAVRDGGILCACSSYEEEQSEIDVITQKPAAQVQDKAVLTLAVMYLDRSLRKQVMEFNRTNEQYRIQVNDYSEYSTSEDYTAGMTMLSTEIISGHVPDIIDVSELPVSMYIGKGLL